MKTIYKAKDIIINKKVFSMEKAENGTIDSVLNEWVKEAELSLNSIKSAMSWALTNITNVQFVEDDIFYIKSITLSKDGGGRPILIVEGVAKIPYGSFYEFNIDYIGAIIENHYLCQCVKEYKEV